jgi:hypothetical protein
MGTKPFCFNAKVLMCSAISGELFSIAVNNNFRRFTLRGLEKIELEFGLMALAHNLRKKIAA